MWSVQEHWTSFQWTEPPICVTYLFILQINKCDIKLINLSWNDFIVFLVEIMERPSPAVYETSFLDRPVKQCVAMNNGQYSKIFDRWMQQMTNQYICIWEVWELCNHNAKVYTFKQTISKRKSGRIPFSLLFSFEPVHD